MDCVCSNASSSRSIVFVAKSKYYESDTREVAPEDVFRQVYLTHKITLVLKDSHS